MNNTPKCHPDDGLKELIKAAHRQPSVPESLEHRIMLAVARRAITRSKRRAKMGLAASLSGLGMLLAGCLIVLLNWFPHYLPFTESLRMRELLAGLSRYANLPPIFEQWGPWITTVLLAGSAAGFIYYLNSLFSNTFPED